MMGVPGAICQPPVAIRSAKWRRRIKTQGMLLPEVEPLGESRILCIAYRSLPFSSVQSPSGG